MPLLRNDLPPVAAVVVAYFPEINVLNELLRSLSNDLPLTVLIDNGGAAHYLYDTPSSRSKVTYICMGGNQGLGAALNRGVRAARAAGMRYVITFDQDSAPPSGMVATLYRALAEQLRRGRMVAAVGPVFYDVRDETKTPFPLYREENGNIKSVGLSEETELCKVDMLITSGMLIDSNVWACGLQYDERLIVDYTDTDWCFRARSAGYELLALTKIRMGHTLSDKKAVRILGQNFLRYSPERRYYYFRNTIYFIAQPYVSTAWRNRIRIGMLLRILVHLILDRNRWAAFLLSIKGICHGRKGLLGLLPSTTIGA